MQLHSQLININFSNLEIDPKALLAFQSTSASTYLIDAEKLTPFKGGSASYYFEMPLVYRKEGKYFVIANWLYLQGQFASLIELNNELPVVLLEAPPKSIESIAWQYALHSFARSNSRKTAIASLFRAMLTSPIRHLSSFSSAIVSKVKKSSLETLCPGETRQSIATQIS